MGTPARSSAPKFAGWRDAVAVALLCLASGCAAPHAGRDAFAPRDEFHRVTLGLCEDYPEESRSLANARRDLEVLRTNHIPVLRVAFGWDAIEPEPGRFDWSFWDDFVRLAVD